MKNIMMMSLKAEAETNSYTKDDKKKHQRNKQKSYCYQSHWIVKCRKCNKKKKSGELRRKQHFDWKFKSVLGLSKKS